MGQHITAPIPFSALTDDSDRLTELKGTIFCSMHNKIIKKAKQQLMLADKEGRREVISGDHMERNERRKAK